MSQTLDGVQYKQNKFHTAGHLDLSQRARNTPRKVGIRLPKIQCHILKEKNVQG